MSAGKIPKGLQLRLKERTVEGNFLFRVPLQIEGPAPIFLLRVLDFDLVGIECGDRFFISVKEEVLSFLFVLEERFSIEKGRVIGNPHRIEQGG